MPSRNLIFRTHAIRRMFERKKTMKCVVCRQAETRPGKATVTLERNGTTVVFKGVPARVCPNCGEEYVDEEVTRRLLELANEAARAGVHVDVREYKVPQPA